MRSAVLLIAAALAAGCAAPEPRPARDDMVVVLPEQDGKVGAVVVNDGRRDTTLGTAYSALQTGEKGELQARTSSAGEVRRIFGPALAAQPARPISLTLYFTEGNTLSDESKAVVQKMFAEIAKRPAPEVTVIGHTDTIGTDDYNDKLSLERAQTVREILIGMGVPPENITAAGRGKREVLVPTGDNINEPRNRRVELSVR
jgi:outer membrane protein OmpA-like peptidoglycan-associated protein